jgi:hypothetical protein
MKNTGWSSWCEPAFRDTRKLIVCKGDVTEALRWYKDKTGHLPAQIVIHPANEYHKEEVPEGIEVEFSKGVGLWEIRLAGEKKAVEKAVETFEEGKTALDNHHGAYVGLTTIKILTPQPPDVRKSTTRIMTRLKKASANSPKHGKQLTGDKKAKELQGVMNMT